MNMPKEHLILVSVGPVQDFIAAGRKVRDIWYGSDCLSELSKRVARYLHSRKCKLVFPCPDDPDKELSPNSSLNVVNRVMAVSPDDAPPENIAECIGEDVRRFWRELAEEAERAAPGLVAREIYDSQIADLGELYIVWTPLNGDYRKSRERVEKLMSARKCARTFQPPSWTGDCLPKSSLDGIRESVLKDENAPQRSHGRIREGEHLDALAFIKRVGSFQKAEKFDSLIDVAVRTYTEQMKTCPAMAEAYAGLKKEGELLAREMLAGEIGWPEAFYINRLENEIRGRNDARLNSFLSEVRQFQKKHGEPEHYLCFLLGDGDNMGKTLDSLPDMSAHQRFSMELSRFAQKAERIVRNDHDGELIYSGGDDVMAYLPMHTALACAVALNKEFGATMKRACGEPKGGVPTFSAGLVITHHSESLAEIFAQARAAEHDAKEKGEKNALALWQNKRQQRGIRLAGKWDSFPNRLLQLTDLYLEDGLPRRFGYQLRVLSAQCGDSLTWGRDATPGNVASAEVTRMLGRKVLDKPGKETLSSLLGDYDSIQRLSDELVVARQFAVSIAMARGLELSEEDD